MSGSQPRRFAPIGLAVVALVAVVLLTSGASGGHHVFVTVPDATDALAGQDIRAAGQNVGTIASITPVQHGRAVRLDLQIGNAAWPLPSGSQFTLKWGGTISYDNRYIALVRGPAGATSIHDGATIPSAAFATPVEFDQLINTFTPKVQHDVKALIRRGGVTFSVAQPNLRRAIVAGSPALTQASYVLRDLDANETALNTLVRSTDNVVNAVQSANPGVGQLVSSAATTFSAVASQATQLQATLSAAPPTLTDARATLAHADRTLGAAQDLAARLAPGVEQVRKIASPLNSVLATVLRVGPNAIATLQSARQATPDLNPLLVKATTLMPELGSIGRQSVTQLNCIRPYTPDIIAFFSTWGDWLSPSDGTDRYGRANAESLLPAGNNISTLNSGQAAQQYPGLRYGFPRPPGYNAGQPWFLPQCGAGPSALDPTQDPEARPYNPLAQLPLSGGAARGSAKR
jgi:ABC-type transporter Mla subunit MlaD